MRHPLRALIPPVQSQHNKQNKRVTGSQQLRHLKTAKSYLLLRRSYFRPFPFHRLQTAQCLRPEETVQHLVKWIVIIPSQFPDRFDGLRSRQELLFFWASRFFMSFEKQYFPGCLSQISAGLRLSRPFCAPLWLPERSLR